MTPMAGKFGATSAIRTGRAPARLSWLPNPAPRKAPEHPSIDGCKAKCNKSEASEILGREGFAEEQSAKKDRDRGHEERHKQCVGSSGPVDQPEIEHIAKSGAEQRQRSNRRKSAERRHRVDERPVDEHR